MLIDLTRQTDKLLFVGMPSRAMRARCGDICYCPAPLGIVTLRKSLFDAPAKVSPVQGEVAKIFDFCRRGCCISKLPLCRNLCEFEAFSTQSLSQKSEIFDSSLYTREPWRSRASASSSGLYRVTIPSVVRRAANQNRMIASGNHSTMKTQWCYDNCKLS